MQLALIIQISLPVSLIMIMFSIGLKLRLHDFRQVFVFPRAFATGLAGQLLLVPLIAVLVVWLTGLQGALAVGLLILSFSPGGTSSNLFSDLAGGNVALSVCLTAVAGLIVPFTLPLLTEQTLRFFGDTVSNLEFPVYLTMLRLVIVTLLPLLLAMLCRQYFPEPARRLRGLVGRLAASLFALTILLIVLQQLPGMADYLKQVGGPVSLMLVLAIASGFALGKLAKLPATDQKTIAIEIGMQNGGMALLVTEGVLHEPDMSVAPVIYGLVMLVPVLLLVWIGRRESSGAL
ncbi:MAG: bile acid:sodium symporter family protein [Gammaproteobacteria bacterium]|nr:bile acid:sodium symporter family protein [Gammaproteobacteria bacterium]